MTTLVIATRNAHKAAEIRAILSDHFRLLTLQDVPGAPEVEEDAPTFASNATKKAVELARWLANARMSNLELRREDQTFVLADDSGLEVDALDGAPGVYSARFAARYTGQSGNSSDAGNNAKLLRLLERVPSEKRAARFRCVLALTPVCTADEGELQTELFEGVCEGRIAFTPGGAGGFGYDPLFIPEGYKQSFGELDGATKNQISHRSRALAKLRGKLDLLARG